MERELFKFDLELEGMDDVLAALDRAEAEVMDALERAQEENTEDLMGKAVELAPILTGTLRRSAEPEVSRDATGVTGVVSFNTPYAVRRHEENYKPGPLTAASPGIDGMPAGRKYLERPLKANAKKYVEHAADRVREVL